MVSYLAGPACTLTLGVMSALSAPPGAADSAPVRLRAAAPVTVGAARPKPHAGSTLEPPGPFSRLCVTPCTTELSLDSHTLAVLRDDGTPLVAFPTFRVSGPTTLELTVASRESERTLGFWITVLSLSLGAATTAAGLIPTCGDDESCARHASLAIWGGIGIASVGGTFGIPLMLRDDEVTLRVEPSSSTFERR